MIPEHIAGEIGYYALAAETSLCAGTFEAAQVKQGYPGIRSHRPLVAKRIGLVAPGGHLVVIR